MSGEVITGWRWKIMSGILQNDVWCFPLVNVGQTKGRFWEYVENGYGGFWFVVEEEETVDGVVWNPGTATHAGVGLFALLGERRTELFWLVATSSFCLWRRWRNRIVWIEDGTQMLQNCHLCLTETVLEAVHRKCSADRPMNDPLRAGGGVQQRGVH